MNTMKNNVTNTLCSRFHSWRFLLQQASACVPHWEKSFPAKLSNETSFKMDSILICTRLLVNQKAPCLRSATCRGIQLCDTFSLVPQIKQILRRYDQPSEFSGFPVHILRHIFLLYWDHKTIKKTAKSILLCADGWSFAKTTTRRISAFNFRWFQQPIRSCGIVLTANQRCGQNLAAVSTNLWEFVSGPTFSGSR